MTQPLTARAREVLACPEPDTKAALAVSLGAVWAANRIAETGEAGAPETPARPARPELRPTREMPKRRAGRSPTARIALLHALAHIELNAIDLAFDLVARFADPALPRAFYDDWVAVGAEEAAHYRLLAGRLSALGAAYGDLPAHAGLWEAAAATRDDLLARLAVVPLVLEARGLDVTPAMIERMTRWGDTETAAILTTILREETGHVATGRRWFEWEAARRGLDPAPAWRALVAERFRGELKPPFNDAARREAGFGPDWYAPAAGSDGNGDDGTPRA